MHNTFRVSVSVVSVKSTCPFSRIVQYWQFIHSIHLHYTLDCIKCTLHNHSIMYQLYAIIMLVLYTLSIMCIQLSALYTFSMSAFVVKIMYKMYKVYNVCLHCMYLWYVCVCG